MKNILILTTLFLSNILMGQHSLHGTLMTAPNISASDLQELNNLNLTSDNFSSQEKCRKSGQVDICFLVDATSSMSDQLEFLQSSIHNLLNELEKTEAIHFRTSAVLYRDHSDSFVTQSFPFSDKSESTFDFLKTYTATGGGDYPEALSEGFWQAMQLEWEAAADQKILFMFSDAPPHDHPVSLKLFAQGIDLAAKKGITIIPVLGIEVNDFMLITAQYLAAKSNGSLIQLLEMTEESSSEEHSLYAMISEILPPYISLEECNQDLKDEHTLTIFSTPNPANDQVFVTTTAPMKSIEIRSVEGKIVFQKKLQATETKINTSEWPSGVYFLNVFFDNGSETAQLIIQH